MGHWTQNGRGIEKEEGTGVFRIGREKGGLRLLPSSSLQLGKGKGKNLCFESMGG